MRLLGCVIAAAAVLQLSEALSPTSLYYSCHDEDPAECARLVSNGSCLGWFKNSGDGEVNLSVRETTTLNRSVCDEYILA